MCTLERDQLIPTAVSLTFCLSIPHSIMPLAPHPLRHFFAVWDVVEQMHPWGVERMQPMLLDFGVSAALCAEVDARLYVDLMIARQPSVQRIRVEGRHTRVVFWVQVDWVEAEDPGAHNVDGVGEVVEENLDAQPANQQRVTLSFQRTPAAPFCFRVSIAARPSALVACLVGYHRVVLLRGHVAKGCGERMLVGRLFGEKMKRAD